MRTRRALELAARLRVGVAWAEGRVERDRAEKEVFRSGGWRAEVGEAGKTNSLPFRAEVPPVYMRRVYFDFVC